MSFPSTLADIRSKVRRITGRPSGNQITDAELDNYINTYYRFDFPQSLKLESLRVNYEFTTTPNISVYDFPVDSYVTNDTPIYIGGYQSYMTQSRGNFFRIAPEINFLQQSVATGNNGTSYTGTLSNLPIVPGFKANPPGAYSNSGLPGNDVPASELKWNVLFSGAGSSVGVTSGIPPAISLIDDGQGNLFAPTDATTDPASRRGTINYITGAFTLNFTAAIPTGNAINAQYIPYQPSRPQMCMFFEDQFVLWPIPDQAYTVSIDVYKYPTAFDGTPTTSPQLQEWWQLIAYGAALKIFADNADFENYSKFKAFYDEQLMLVQRRTIVQYTKERTATIYTEQLNGAGQFPFGNLFGGV